MGVALYRKYRSRRLSDVVGQPHITETLDSAIKSGRISHAYLFTGPRGVGKTSVARILAHQINDLPYEDDDSLHLDIIEIDAASNRGIDEIRDLREKVHIAPTSASYKVYIIDEVHMLTKDAFNALLKTLEEPPKHAVFVLATTEAHKLPDTIISRTQRHTFKPVDRKLVINHLKTIAKQEKFDVEDDALELLAAHGEGSFRDSISLLDQMRSSDGSITKLSIQKALGLADEDLINHMLFAIDSRQKQEIDAAINQVVEKGLNIPVFAEQLSNALRARVVASNSVSEQDIELLKDLSVIQASPEPRVALWMSLYKPIATAPQPVQAVTPEMPTTPSSEQSPATDMSPVPQENHDMPENDQFNEQNMEESYKEQANDQESVSTNEEAPTPGSSGDIWQEVLNAIKGKHNTLYGLVRMAHANMTESEVILEFEFPFHERRFKDAKNRKIVEQIVHDKLGPAVSITSRVRAKKKASSSMSATPKKNDTNNVKNISNIFGNAEVVES